MCQTPPPNYLNWCRRNTDLDYHSVFVSINLQGQLDGILNSGLKNWTITHKRACALWSRTEAPSFILTASGKESDAHFRRTWKRCAGMRHTAQRTKLFSSFITTLIGERWHNFSLGIIPILGMKSSEKEQKQMKIIIFLRSHWRRS